MKYSIYLVGGLLSLLVACKGKGAQEVKFESDSTGIIDSINKASSDAITYRNCSSDTSILAVVDIPFSTEKSIDSLFSKIKEKHPTIGAIIDAREGGSHRQYAGEGPLSSKGSAGIFVSCEAKDSAEITSLRRIFDLYRCDAEDEPRLCGDSRSEFPISRAQAVVDSLNLNFKAAHASVSAAFYPKLGKCLDSLEYSVSMGVIREFKLPVVLVPERVEL